MKNIDNFALKTLENYVRSCKPKSVTELKNVIEKLTLVIVGAMASSHGSKGTLKVIQEINEQLIRDIQFDNLAEELEIQIKDKLH